jgi:hypothetical protein
LCKNVKEKGVALSGEEEAQWSSFGMCGVFNNGGKEGDYEGS